jgi:nucleotide-binding universal stress UspA family protein
MKSVLLHVGDDDALAARVQAALSLTAYASLSGGWMTGELIDRLTQRESELQSRVEGWLKRDDVPWDYVRCSDDPAQSLISHSSLSDLIVMGRTPEPGLASRLWIGDVVLGADAPVMLVPDKADSIVLGAPAMVAWNASVEAARAVRRSLPLLKQASRVHLVVVEEEKERVLPSLAAAEYLSRHGVHAELHELPAGRDGIAQTLLDKARSLKASYIAMGAYGRGRAREFLLGGVTQQFLKTAPIPLLLSR